MLYRRGNSAESFRCGSNDAPLSTMDFSGTCCTAVMAYVPSSFSRQPHTGRDAGAATAVSAPEAVFRHAVRYPADLNLHTVGNRLPARPTPTGASPSTSLSAWCRTRRQGNLPVKGQKRGGAVNGQNPPAQSDAGIILVAKPQSLISRERGAAPPPPHTQKSTARVSSSSVYQPQPGAVCACPRLVQRQTHPFYQIASVVTDGDRVFRHQFRGRLPAIIRVSPVHLYRIMAVLRTEANGTVYPHPASPHCCGYRSRPYPRSGLSCTKVSLARSTPAYNAWQSRSRSHIPRLTLLRQIRIKGHTRPRSAELSGPSGRSTGLLRTAPTCPRPPRRFAVPCHNGM